MKYLLDTNILIWFFDDNKMLPQKIKNLIENKNNDIYISIISLWEIVMKFSKKNLEFKYNFDQILASLNTMKIEIIPLKVEHLKTNIDLPIHHKDPFDRILISTAISENLKFITSDKENHLYDNVKWVWEKNN